MSEREERSVLSIIADAIEVFLIISVVLVGLLHIFGADR
jgi:hypothetical protein